MEKIRINLDEKLFNPVYLPYLNDTIRTQIFFGGSSSGKSVFLSQRCVKDVLDGNRNYLIVRNTGRTIRASVFNEINKVIDEWELRDRFNINKTDMTFTCANDCQILCTGLDDVQKTKSITPKKGVITDIWIEEATEARFDDYKQLTKRLRGKARVPKRITLSFNPIMLTHWIFKEFFKSFHDTDTKYKDTELSILKTTYKDNQFLEPEDAHYLESEKNEYYYNVYTLGAWGVLGNIIFDNWRVEDLTDIRNTFSTYYNGLDFGYTNDPTAFARCSIKDKRRLYITDEIYKYGMSYNDMETDIKPIIGNEILRCDPSEPRSIQELRNRSLNAISARGGPGSVNYGIQFLKEFEIIIDREAQNAINEFQVYQWEQNKDGETMNVPVDKNNHFIDALRYSVSGVSFKESKRKPLTKAMLGVP